MTVPFNRDGLRKLMLGVSAAIAKDQGWGPLTPEDQAIVDAAREKHLDLMMELGKPKDDKE